MRKNFFCLTLCAMLFALCSSADAQDVRKNPQRLTVVEYI